MLSLKQGFKRFDRDSSSQEFLLVCKSLFPRIAFLEGSYPNFRNWFHKKVIHGVTAGERILLIAHLNNAIAGFAILKNTPAERKICTLYVFPEHQSKGLGVQLFKESMAILESEKPLLSVSQDRLPIYDKLFAYFGYDFVENYQGLYVPQKNELSFNGLLI